LEPTLGAPEARVNPPWGCGFAYSPEGSQLHWADGDCASAFDDAEEPNEDGGDILDEPEWSEPIPGGSEIGADAWEGKP
ncbi:MAG TPA: hypothetical protein VGO22_16635, partial [Pseudorhizobium sp.]|nr:hypothetical protein [Pseudorhizobium sp.]